MLSVSNLLPVWSSLFHAARIKFASPINHQTAPYRSPKLHLTRPGARVVPKPRQRPHAKREAQQELDELSFYRRLHSYGDRSDISSRHQDGLEGDEGGDWADESTLIAMLQDKYVHCFHLTRPAFLLDALHFSATHSRTRTAM